MSFWGIFKPKTKTKLPEEELIKHRCAFTGHRPEKLVGKESYVIKELRSAIEASIDAGYTTFITGCSRGVDLWAADIVLEMRRHDKRLKLICAIPFEGFADKWPIDWQKHLELVKKDADWIQVVSKEYNADAYQKRNVWMVNKASKLIAVCNGDPSGTLNTIRYVISKLTQFCQAEKLILNTHTFVCALNLFNNRSS